MCIFFSPLLVRLSEEGQTLNKYKWGEGAGMGHIFLHIRLKKSVEDAQNCNFGGGLKSEEKVQNQHHNKIQCLGRSNGRTLKGA